MNKLEEKGLVPKLRFSEFKDAPEWSPTTFGATATFINGKAYKQEELLENGKYRVLRVGNFFTNKEWYFSDLELDENKYCDNGDLLYAWSASFGPRIWLGEKVIYHYHIWKVLEKKHIDKNFLFILLDYETERMKAATANGLGLMHITKSSIENWKCCIPSSIEEQKKIANSLSSLDELISAHTQKFDTLKAYKKGLMQQLFPAEGETVPKLRFPEFQGEWRKTQLKKLGELVSGLTYSPADVRDSGLLVLRSSNVKNGIISLKDNVYVTPNVKGANLSKANDILICVRNGSKALIGKNALIPEGMPVCTHGAFMTVFRSPSAKFVFQLFQTNAYQKQVDADLGATINSINGRHFIKYEFYVPESFEQQKIADCLSSIDELITAQSHKIDALKVHKQGLMQQLFPTVGVDCIDAEDRATQNAEVEVSA
ncbi:restriction endonuclease subunit S [Shewanella baltica]|uniref:Restriction modification system DNA specificity domain n=1 Tax=Shewanella baltica (strain OS155 / ATCC BAA-1091) TaxID=325240 RepID=A3D8X8_SHEB5|nr:restriction endonuclease subunit S [Shewanella baltica]ABN63191.1 restriction modification system DNA specificity domain [Shewanella baltica OS155]AEH15538.1 restriction modification system DNA specificity domain protein [Shewanella baltica OS117]